MIFFILFIISFLSGQVLVLDIGDGIRISALDMMMAAYVLWLMIKFNRLWLKNYLLIFAPFLVIAILSLIFNLKNFGIENILLSSLYLVRFVGYSLLIFLPKILNLNKKQILKGLYFTGVILAVLGLLQYWLYPNLRNLAYLGWDPHQFRLFATILDPNFCAVLLGLNFILGIELYHRFLNKYLIVFSELITLFAICLTFSRGGYLAFLISMFVYIFWSLKLKFIWKIGLIGVFGICFIGIIYLLPRPSGEGVNLLRTMSIDSRIENNQEAFNLFSKSPVWGWGFNTLRLAREKLPNAGINEISHSASGFQNSWLYILATTGILGIIAYLWIWIKIIPKVDITEKLLLLTSVILVGIHGFFDNSLFFIYIMWWLWILVGASLEKYFD